MTKNRARKRAVRERAHLTGESYVVARRNTMAGVPTPAAEPSSPAVATLHRWTHLVPGVPAHPDAATMAARHPSSVRRARTNANHGTHPVRRKRILVGWQTRIENLVRGGRDLK